MRMECPNGRDIKSWGMAVIESESSRNVKPETDLLSVDTFPILSHTCDSSRSHINCNGKTRIVDGPTSSSSNPPVFTLVQVT